MTTAVCVIGKKGSKAVTQIVQNTGLTRFSRMADVVVNYGLAGDRLQQFAAKHPGINKKPMLNKYNGCGKYKAIQDAEVAGIAVPVTKLSLSKADNPSEFLTKRNHSQGGVGIKVATTRSPLNGCYYQKFASNRKFELRVHGFLWTDQKSWLIQKRLGDKNQIAWNFQQGGHFQSIRRPNDYKVFTDAKAVTERILKMRHMAFGAVDFIVTLDNQLLFLEVNSAPGFTDLSRPAYVEAFSVLTTAPKTKIIALCD